MVMKCGEKRQEERVGVEMLRGRTGHRVARLNDSVFVLGGTDEKGLWVHELHRINCQNHRLDSLILDTLLPLEGFSFFCLREALLVWGGRSYSQVLILLCQFSNQLLQFDGARFHPLRQRGQVPTPRAEHLSTTFGNKYLIIFGGHNGLTFFKDWFLCNLETNQWTQLHSSTVLPFASAGQMIWTGGRGILLLNDVFDEQLKKYHSNMLYQFYVSDFNKGSLIVTPLSISAFNSPTTPLFTHLLPYNSDSFLLLGGYRRGSISKVHNLCYRVQPETDQVEKLCLMMPKVLGFEAIYYKSSLMMVGGDILKSSEQQSYHGLYVHQLAQKSVQATFRRHVCEICRLYYDEEWKQCSSEVYSADLLKQQYDYNYKMRLDNQVLHKMSSYIRSEFYALILILKCLKNLQAFDIEVSLHKVKEDLLDKHEQGYQYLKLHCGIKEEVVSRLVNQILLQKRVPEDSKEQKQRLRIDELVLQLKLASFRLGRTTLMVFRLSSEQVFVLYYSSSQLQCPNTHFASFPSYSYTFNLRTKQSSSPLQRQMILQNLRPLFKTSEEYEQSHSDSEMSYVIIVICGEQIQSQLNFYEQSIQLQTGQSSLGLKDDSKRSVPLLQLAFLHQTKMPHVYIEHNLLNFVNLYQMLQNDSNSKILEAIQPKSFNFKALNPKIVKSLTLFHYPEQFWFKRVLIYHRGMLLSHFKMPDNRICGIIQLSEEVELDLAATNLARYEDKKYIQGLLDDLRSYKRK